MIFRQWRRRIEVGKVIEEEGVKEEEVIGVEVKVVEVGEMDSEAGESIGVEVGEEVVLMKVEMKNLK
jgi:hypothetical protein